MESNPNQHLEMPELANLLERSRQSSSAEFRPEEAHPHFALCGACREQFESLAGLDRELKSQLGSLQGSESPALAAECPGVEVWNEIAGGVTGPELALGYVEHASRCDYCGPRLRAAIEEVIDLNGELTDAEREKIASLDSARLEWQLKLAERISGSPRSDRSRTWWGTWHSAPRLVATATAAVIVVAAVGWWAWGDRGSASSANQLLARAYTDQRTLELRIPGAGYAPLRVQRGPAESFVGRPAALLKAEALIAGQLASHPEDPAWLQASARANMLEGKYDAAVESLQRAVELQPHSPELLADLGTAHFQRAQSEDRQEDYGAAYEYFSKALELQPENATALFNRAIVAEHQFLYRQALDDWELYLKLDSRSEWADEARSRAEAVREKLKEHESGAAPLLSPEQVASAIAGASADVDRRVEQYLDAAVRSWLPQAYPEGGKQGDPQAQRALFFLADLTAQKHNDRWLTDLLRGSSAPKFSRAAAALARASQTNYSGDYTAAREQAGIAAQLFRTSGNQAGVLRAQFEQAYSEQLTRHTDECRRDASAALAESERLPYSWLQVQLGLETGVCFFLGQDDWGADERFSRRAMERARESDYDGLHVRALYFIADDQIGNGDLFGGLKSAALALQRYWSAQIPPFLGFNLYSLLGSVPEFEARRPRLTAAIWREATALADADSNLLNRAWAHSFAARAAAGIHLPDVAEQHYVEAVRLFALAPRTEATQNSVLLNEIFAAGVEARLDHFDSGIARLTRIQGQIRPDEDKYVEEMFYATLGELELRSGRVAQAERAFRPALESWERRLGSLNSEAERINWSKEAAPVYLGLTEAELVQGRAAESLQYFEWYLAAPGRSGRSRRNRTSDAAPDPALLTYRLPLLSGETVVAYGALPDGLAIWTFDNRGVNAQWIPQSNQDLQELAGRYYDLASDARSELTALHRDSQSLYRALVAPVDQRLEAGRTLVIEANGWLARVPFESLLDSSGHYLIERAPIVHSLGRTTDASLHEDMPMTRDLNALIVASAASPQTEGLIPLPDVVAEAEAVARDFHSPAVLKGSEATLGAIEASLPAAAVFHFTGHSVARPTGAALLLEAGKQPKNALGLLSADRFRRLDLRNLQLAVLSTCNTASGSDGSRGFSRIAESLERAGVPHVVASRWAVDSVETRKFIETFYRNALSGQPVSEAIRETSRSMMSDPRTAHPYYWSAFSAYGRP